MPRTARGQIKSSFYHVIIRGIGKQILFEEPDDFQFFLKHLKRLSTEACVGICAYCLMENHVHLLAHDENEALSRLMQRLGIIYAAHFNYKYERTGHLLQDRFKSEPIYTDAQLLIVFRYILQNPQKAGICPARKYARSSYGQYFREKSWLELDTVRALIGDRDAYEAFIEQENDDECMEDVPRRKNDEWAKAVIRKAISPESAEDPETLTGIYLQKCSRRERDRLIGALKARGMTIRQIERLTGISRGVIQRVK